MAIKRNCGRCYLQAANKGVCPIFQTQMADEYGCPKFIHEPDPCELCGNQIVGDKCFFEHDETWHQLCANCLLQHLYKCGSCRKNTQCAFENDSTISLPQMVQVTTRQGNMFMQTVTKNPERIKLTCENGCDCWLNGACAKETIHCCSNYEFNTRE